MGNKKVISLIEEYELICSQIVKAFCRKQAMVFEGWIADKIGEIATCNDFHFDLTDIVLDMKTNQPKGLIIDWYYNDIENLEHKLNYATFIKLKKHEKNNTLTKLHDDK